jgi:hypothetical protein
MYSKTLTLLVAFASVAAPLRTGRTLYRVISALKGPWK